MTQFSLEQINAATVELYGLGATYEPDQVRRALEAAALASPPPADDVREAARKRLDERGEYAETHGYPAFQDEPSAYLHGFEDGAAFEPRSLGTVTEAAIDAAGRHLGMDDGMEHWIDRESVREALEAAAATTPLVDDVPGGCIHCWSSGVVEDYDGDRPCSACDGTGTPRPR